MDINTPLKTRLFVSDDLAEGDCIALQEAQSHFLRATLRSRVGDRVALFNGRDGEWLGEISEIGKKNISLRVIAQKAPLYAPPSLFLLFAPVKNEKIDYTVRRATELGVTDFFPVMTDYTIVSRVNEERLLANCVEAAEQCGRTETPRVHATGKLEKRLSEWEQGRILLHADESGDAPAFHEAVSLLGKEPKALLIGPEGGFSPAERAMLKTLTFVRPIHLGPRILRAETAALAALSCLQALCGDWQRTPHFNR